MVCAFLLVRSYLRTRTTLLLWGDDDKVIPPAYGPAFHDLIPGSKLVVFKDCGHVPHREQAGRVLQCVAEFVSTIADA